MPIWFYWIMHLILCINSFFPKRSMSFCWPLFNFNKYVYLQLFTLIVRFSWNYSFFNAGHWLSEKIMFRDDVFLIVYWKKKCITMKCLCVNAFFFVAMKMFPVYSKLQNSITGNNQFSFFVYSTKNEKNMDKSCSFIYIYQYHIVLQF